MLTTLRIVWCKGGKGMEIPLFYVSEAKKSVNKVILKLIGSIIRHKQENRAEIS